MDAQVRDPSQADGRLGFYTKSVTVKEAKDGDDEPTTIEVPVSGLAEDRDGDKLADSAIDSMVDQLNSGGVPMFPNHGYDSENGVPQAYRYEDIIGGWTGGRRDGDVVIAEGKLREGKQAADELLDLFSQEMPVGFSIGFGWDEGNAEQRDNGGLRFEDMDLMEISPVGIQSHPDAATSDGLKVASALSEAGIDPSTIDTDELKDALMTSKESNDEEEHDSESKEEMDDEEEEKNSTQKLSADELDGIMEIFNAHHEAAKEDVREFVEVSDGGEETEASEDYGDDDEDKESDDDKEDKAADELRKELETLRNELEAVKTDAAGSRGPKGGMVVSDTDDVEGKDESTDENKTPAASVAEQAAHF